MSITELIIGAIKENKPNIGESSLKTYISILKNLFKKYGKDNEFNINHNNRNNKFIHLQKYETNNQIIKYNDFLII